MKNLTLDIKQDIDNSKSKCSRVVITFLLRRTRIAGVVACGVILFTVMGVSGNSAQAKNLRVRVGVYDNSPKISLSANGQPEGIFIDIIEEIAKQERWQLEYIYGTWQEGLDRLAAGELDLMPDVAISKSRGDAYVFHKEPVLSDWFQVYAPKGSGIQSVLDLAGKRIAVLDGSIQEETFSNMCNDYGIKMSLVSLPDYHRTLKELENGKVDAVIANRFYGMHHSRTHNLEDTAVIFTPTRLFYAAKATAPSSALLPVIDQHLARMKRESDSVYYNSLRRWSSEPTVSFLPEYVKLIFSFVAFCLLCIVIWNITLRHKIALRTSALTKSNRMLRMLSDCNEALFRYTDEKELLSRICGIITKVGGYTAVWINLINSDAGKDTSRLPITAHAGLNQQELQTLQRILSDAQNAVTH